LDMAQGLKYVQDVIAKDIPGGRVVVHIFTDLRENDWRQDSLTELANLVKMKKKDDESTKLKIDDLRVRIMDVAHPFWGKRPGTPDSHGNLALVDFRAGSRVAGKDMPIVFTAEVANFGNREAEFNIDVFDVETGERRRAVVFSEREGGKGGFPAKIAPGQKLKATFDKRFPGRPGQDTYYVHLMAKLKQTIADEKASMPRDALVEDNVRYSA